MGTQGVRSNPFVVEGVDVQPWTLAEASQRICDEIEEGTSFSVFTINLDHVVKLRNDPAFRVAYGRARVVLADGFPIVLSGRLQGRDVTRTAGSDLIVPLCREAGKRAIPVLLFGSTPASLAGAADALKAAVPDLEIAGAQSPALGFDPLANAAAGDIEFIRNSGARICFLALGAPKQEIFADRCAREIEGVCFVCIGAGLDFLTGHQKRAPKAFRATGLEWLWRMLLNPRRLAKRYAECLIVLPSVLKEGFSRRSMGG